MSLLLRCHLLSTHPLTSSLISPASAEFMRSHLPPFSQRIQPAEPCRGLRSPVQLLHHVSIISDSARHIQPGPSRIAESSCLSPPSWFPLLLLLLLLHLLSSPSSYRRRSYTVSELYHVLGNLAFLCLILLPARKSSA
jgi:hypothetical protein